MSDGGDGGIKAGAVVLGVLADFGATLVLSIGLGVLAGVMHGGPGMTEAQLTRLLATDPVLVAAGLLAGVAGTMLGGFVAALVAKERELLHAGVAGVLMVVLAVVLMLAMPQPVPGWYYAVALGATIPAALAGGAFRRAMAPAPASADAETFR